jgi:hypothetical protein
MGPEKVKEKKSSFLSRACRLPGKAMHRVSELSETIYKEHFRHARPKGNIPYKFLIIATVLLIYQPWFPSLSFAIPPQVNLTLRNTGNSVPSCQVSQNPETGLTHAVLLNNTPFALSNEWDVYPFLTGSDFDINKNAKVESDGYHLEYHSAGYTSLFLSRVMQIPIFNYSDISVSVETEGISGNGGIRVEAFAGPTSNVAETAVLPNNAYMLNVSAPLEEARQATSSWLETIKFHLEFALTNNTEIIIKSVVIEANFTTNLSRVQLDVQNTENCSLYENPYTKEIDSPLKIIIVQNNDSSSVAVYTPRRVNDELYLPPATYEGVSYWDYGYHDSQAPDPTNATSWKPNVDFTVNEDAALMVAVRLSTIRLNINVSPRLLLRHIFIQYANDSECSRCSEYSISTDIVGSTLYTEYSRYFYLGSTLYTEYPESFYLPGIDSRLYLSISFWHSLSPWTGQYPSYAQSYDIYEVDQINMNSTSMNIDVSVTFSFVTIGNMVLGLGEFLLMTTDVILIAWSVITIRRELRHSDLRHRLSDSRLLPILLLIASVFLPWSIQWNSTAGPGYDGVYWVLWFSTPLMIRWTDGTAIQVLSALSGWWYASLISTNFLILPIFYSCFSLSSPEGNRFNRKFAVALLMPYMVVLSGFYYSVLDITTISVGPLLAIAALPVWLLRLALRRLGITK